MFEVTSFVELKVRGRNRPLTFDLSLTPLARHEDKDAEVNSFAGTVAAKFEDGWHRVTGVDLTWSGIAEKAPMFGATLDNGLEFEYFFAGQELVLEFPVRWEPVGASTVAKVIDLLSEYKTLLPSNFKSPSVQELEYRTGGAAEFERALYTGLLESILIAECRKLKQQLAARVSKRQQALKAQTASMLARWRSMGQQIS